MYMENDEKNNLAKYIRELKVKQNHNTIQT